MSDEQERMPYKRKLVLAIMNVERVEHYRDAAVMGRMLAEISKELRVAPLAEIEAHFRSKGSDTYFIGLDAKEMPEFESQLPHSGDKEYPYYLWIEVNGAEEAKKVLEMHGLSEEENRGRLGETGMLVPKEGTTVSRRVHARDN